MAGNQFNTKPRFHRKGKPCPVPIPGYPVKPDPWPFITVQPGIFLFIGTIDHGGGDLEPINLPMLFGADRPAYSGWWKMTDARYLFLVYEDTPGGWQLGGAMSPFVGFQFPPPFAHTLPLEFGEDPWLARFALGVFFPFPAVTVVGELQLPKQLTAGPITPSVKE